jgi:serine/threonine protein phosphatase PrpC
VNEELFCSFCGKTNRPTARFCQHCGQPLEKAPAAAVEASPPVLVEPTEPAALLPPTNGVDDPDQTVLGRFAGLDQLPDNETVAPLPTDTHLPPIEAVTPAEPAPVETMAAAPDLQPLPAGSWLDDNRFVIEEVAQATPQIITYYATDRGQCRHCGERIAQPLEDRFCHNCGSQLEPYLSCLITESGQPGEEPGNMVRQFEANGRYYTVRPVESTAAPPPAAAPVLRLQVGYQSDPGKLRELNEDSVLVTQLSRLTLDTSQLALGFFVVADGIGGHEGGEIASALAVRLLGHQALERFLSIMAKDRQHTLDKITANLEKSIQNSNKVLFEDRQRRNNEMGTTVTAALVVGNQAVVANVGDSRTYLWRGSTLEQVSKDHSLIANLIAAGAEPPEAIYTHEQKSVIYRSLGDKTEVVVDTFQLTLEPGDRLLLCSDGAWEMIRNEGIEEVMLSIQNPQQACDEIVKRANLAGGEDNISIIVVILEAD